MNLKSHRQYVQEQSENEEFAREYEQAQAQARFAVELAMARERQGLTQEQLPGKLKSGNRCWRAMNAANFPARRR